MQKQTVDKKKLNKKIVVTGGGSGGHISACLSIIKELEKRYELDDSNFLYIGGDLGMEGEEYGHSLEQQILKGEDFNKKFIRAGKLQRTFSLRSIKLMFRTFLGFIDSRKILGKFRPDIIISTGGFVTVPVCLIGKSLKSKVYLHEQTSAIGLANKIVGKVADKIFLAFQDSSSYFPEDKTILTGNLVREDIFQKTAEGELKDILERFVKNRNKYPIIYISGGGLGSHSINEVSLACLKILAINYQIVLQTGDNTVYNDYSVIKKEIDKYPKDMRDRILLTKFIGKKDIGCLLNNTDLYVGRAGANTVYELGLLQIPSIFIPISWVTHNEQYKNAQILVNYGLATILNEDEMKKDTFLDTITLFYNKDKKIDKEGLEKVFTKNAADRILDNIGLE